MESHAANASVAHASVVVASFFFFGSLVFACVRRVRKSLHVTPYAATRMLQVQIVRSSYRPCALEPNLCSLHSSPSRTPSTQYATVHARMAHWGSNVYWSSTPATGWTWCPYAYVHLVARLEERQWIDMQGTRLNIRATRITRTLR